MNRKEKDKLATIVGGLIELSDILHPPAANLLIEKIYDSTDEEVLDILISHLHHIKIYALYNRFDQEAGIRDIENLLTIIHQLNNKGS